MLKTFEEPPEHIKFILATTDPQKIPVTVLSRCLQFNLKQMPREAIYGHLGYILKEEKTQSEPAGTAGSQFFVVTGADAGLPPQYAVVGKVTAGLPVVLDWSELHAGPERAGVSPAPREPHGVPGGPARGVAALARAEPGRAAKAGASTGCFMRDCRTKGETPLHRAVEKGFKELAEMLVKAGASPNALNQTGETPLHYAALYADAYFADLLLEAGAEPKARNDDGESALQWAVMTGNPLTARHLLERGADPKATDLKGNTLLHAAADGGHVEMARAFLSLGVDPRQRNREGKRPIEVARERGYPEIVKLLERFERE
jgi:hypothetical protein